MQIRRYTDTQIYRFPDTQIGRYANACICRYTDTQICRYTDLQMCRYADTQILRYTDTQIHRYADTQIPRYALILQGYPDLMHPLKVAQSWQSLCGFQPFMAWGRTCRAPGNDPGPHRQCHIYSSFFITSELLSSSLWKVLARLKYVQNLASASYYGCHSAVRIAKRSLSWAWV